jgi:hypothetical protein
MSGFSGSPPTLHSVYCVSGVCLTSHAWCALLQLGCGPCCFSTTLFVALLCKGFLQIANIFPLISLCDELFNVNTLVECNRAMLDCCNASAIARPSGDNK